MKVASKPLKFWLPCQLCNINKMNNGFSMYASQYAENKLDFEYIGTIIM